MVDAVLVPAIKGAIKSNEIGNASPYVLSYAKLGTSGASFGDCQGDTNSNATARATLLKALQANDTETGAATRIMTAVSRPCPNGNPLSSGDTSTANGALSCDGGRALVDAMDDTLMNVVIAGLDTCITAANTVGQTIELPGTALYRAMGEHDRPTHHAEGLAVRHAAGESRPADWCCRDGAGYPDLSQGHQILQ